MTAYAIGILRDVQPNEEIIEYLERIDATLAPYHGRFLVHGAPELDVSEGEWDADLVIIGFPDLPAARAWYDSPEYQEILTLRTRNSDSTVLLIEGCDSGHQASDVLADISVRAAIP